jgi:quercetin dioxygenase-like cupin family protein
MKYTPLIALFVLGFAQKSLGIEPPPTEVVMFDHATVEQALAKGQKLSINSSFKIQGGHRVGPGVVEIHEHDTDIFYVTQGAATFVTGGTAIDPKSVGPGEFHADKMTGGTVHHLTQGDVIVIPSGIPHQFTEVSGGTFVYFVVKVTK